LSRDQWGQAVLVTVLLLPTLLMVLVVVVQLGLIAAERQRVQAAVDMAALAGTQMVDGSAYSHTGRLQLDATRATQNVRAFLAQNLSLDIPAADERSASVMAATADVRILNDVPARDPFTGLLLDRPAVAIRLELPYRAGLLRLAGLTPEITLTVASDAELRS
jgi:Flp pilus assembly protein TadG